MRPFTRRDELRDLSLEHLALAKRADVTPDHARPGQATDREAPGLQLVVHVTGLLGKELALLGKELAAS